MTTVGENIRKYRNKRKMTLRGELTISVICFTIAIALQLISYKYIAIELPLLMLGGYLCLKNL